ncbi:MAG: hypothetical protein UT66_C0033G0010 [candidate division CPR2 bacterium GW2011_GWC1_39_9]|uniref:Uncharacterized protein n=1 Tax=candidate division CPR2 bacterium GW2011_GWC2_39_10 TaxID=1618345 RepID=A0A0G0M0M2_UNCC2|nr:MAG: hypothetical protein UT18_C0015G0019 [candidate division CPR2 bacterium GW2011_GWC2_39_10]KKR33860.1 MAG: hypothetical protein UT66_C0033G0010 [candidate division CPR2 bacterium GW2011_GWC1_39_9]
MLENCWEIKKCGREPGGKNVEGLGVCPASSDRRLSGFNKGVNGGRACWAIAGTMCNGEVQGTFASKIEDCENCEVYLKIKEEEGDDFKDAAKILLKLMD